MWIEGMGELPGQLIVISGPSGSGKSTVIRRALETSSLKVRLSVSATTRRPRAGEQDRVDYIFLDRAGFNAQAERGAFLEWAEYNGNYYGTPGAPVFESLAQGWLVLLEIDVQGALQVRDRAPTSYFVFVRTSDFRSLERRLRGRASESDEAIHHRLRQARRELAEAHWYDAQLANDDLDGCVGQLVRILQSFQP